MISLINVQRLPFFSRECKTTVAIVFLFVLKSFTHGDETYDLLMFTGVSAKLQLLSVSSFVLLAKLAEEKFYDKCKEFNALRFSLS